MAVRFDTANDRLLGTTGLPSSVTWTITLWLYISVDRNDYSTFASINNSPAPPVAWLNTIGNGTSLGFDTQGGAMNDERAASVGTWYRYGVAIESDGTVRMYEGNATESLVLHTANMSTRIPNAPAELWIGSAYDGSWFNGRVAAFKLWDVALSAIEIESELAQYAPVRTAGLLRYHPFIDSTADLSGNGYTLTTGSSAVTWEAGPDIPEGGSNTGLLSGFLSAPLGTITGLSSVEGTSFGSLPLTEGSIAGIGSTEGTLEGFLSSPIGLIETISSASGTLTSSLSVPSGSIDGLSSTQGLLSGTLPVFNGSIDGSSVTEGALVGDLFVPSGILSSSSAISGSLDGDLFPVSGNFGGTSFTQGELTSVLSMPTSTFTSEDLVVTGDLSGVVDLPVGSMQATSQTLGAFSGVLSMPSGELLGTIETPDVSLIGVIPFPVGSLDGISTSNGSINSSLFLPIGRLFSRPDPLGGIAELMGSLSVIVGPGGLAGTELNTKTARLDVHTSRIRTALEHPGALFGMSSVDNKKFSSLDVHTARMNAIINQDHRVSSIDVVALGGENSHAD